MFKSLSLQSLTLSSYSSGNDPTFIGVQSGTTFTEPLDIYRAIGNSANIANLLGYTLFIELQVETNTLDNIGSGNGAIGFTDALSSGTDTFALQQLDGPSDYELDFNVTAVDNTLPSNTLQVSLFNGPDYLIEDEGTVSAHAFLVIRRCHS